MKYRKKPVIVEALKVSELLKLAKHNWKELPEWVVHIYETGNMLFADPYITIKTLEGNMEALYDDYIIQGIKGEVYPCKPDIFEMTYEKVDE